MENEKTHKHFWRWLILLIGVIVPRRLRADWRLEWDAELRVREESLREWNTLDWKSTLEISRHSLGAFWDALWLQPRRWEDEMIQDLRFGVRMLLKNPGVTLIILLTLALGVGANTAIFSVVNAVVLRPLPFKGTDRLVALWERNPKYPKNEVSAANFLDWREQNQVFEQVAALSYSNLILTGDEPERLSGAVVTPSYFKALGTTASLGRTFLPEEANFGAARVAVLSYGLWERRFTSDREIIGKSVLLNGVSTTVVGVTPPAFQLEFPINRAIDVYLPRVFSPQLAANRSMHFLYVLGQLKQGVAITQAQTEMDAIAARLAQQYPESNKDRGVTLVSLREQIVGDVRRPLFVLLGAVGLVLLIASANVANLLLGRASARKKEIAIRTALGASRLRILRQLLTESALLAGLGGALGLLLAYWGIPLLVSLSPSTIPRLNEIGVDGQTLGFTLLVTIITGVLFGLAPAAEISRTDLNRALKDGGRTSAARIRDPLRSAMVVAEVALALTLLIGAGLLMRSFWRLVNVHPGFESAKMLTMSIALPDAKYGKSEQQQAFFGQAIERIKSLPGVVAVGAGSNLPLTGGNMTTVFTRDDRPTPPTSDFSEADFRIAAGEYFQTLGIPLRAGRPFNNRDAAGSPRVVVVNESAARRFWPGENPVGKRITIREEPPFSCEVVGVVGDVKHSRLDGESRPELHSPFPQTPDSFLQIAVRTVGDPLGLIPAVRREIAAIDRDQPIHTLKTMEQHFAESVSQANFNLRLLGVFAVAAALLAAVGIYGVLSYFVAQRTHEIGVRMALGAKSRDVLVMIVAHAMKLALCGVAIGLAVSLAATRIMKSMLFGIGEHDPITFLAIPALLMLVALFACSFPALRAARTNPLAALRVE